MKITTYRRAALFTAILMSGGLLFIPRLPLLVILFILYAIVQRDTIIRYALFPALGFIALVLGLEVARPGAADVLQIFIRGANFIAALLMANMYYKAGSNAFKSDLYSIVRWFPAQSVATAVLATMFPFLFIQIPGTEIYTFLMVLFHHTTDTSLSFGIVRPDGLFWEPGVFQIYLNFCLYLALFERRDLRMSILSAAGVIFTQSTTGIFIAIALITIYTLSGLKKEKLLQSLAFGALLVPIALYATLNFANKFEGDARGSFIARQYDTLTGLAVAGEYPLIGVGFDVDNYMREAAILGYADLDIDIAVFDDRRGNSNGLVQPLYSLGFVLGTVFLICMLRQSFFKRRILVGLILVVSMTSEPLLFSPFFLMLIFTGMTTRKMPEHHSTSRALSPANI
jgi:hypothetical protein